MLQPIISASVIVEEVILEFNGEFADMGNPNGAIYGKQLHVMAETESGRRFIHCRAIFEVGEVDRAERYAKKVEGHGQINVQHWVETYEVYGSPAWEIADREREVAWQSNPATRGTVRDY